jgi:hypothetical protein
MLKRKSGSWSHAQNLEERMTFVVVRAGDIVIRTLALEAEFIRHDSVKLGA